MDNARFFAGDVRTAMRPLIEEEGTADVVVLDPPRAGLSQKVVRRVLEVEAKTIVYVSCNPTTLAPNARQIVDAGYELVTVRPSTCSRRPRTSNRSRSFSRRMSAFRRTGAAAAAERREPGRRWS